MRVAVAACFIAVAVVGGCKQKETACVLSRSLTSNGRPLDVCLSRLDFETCGADFYARKSCKDLGYTEYHGSLGDLSEYIKPETKALLALRATVKSAFPMDGDRFRLVAWREPEGLDLGEPVELRDGQVFLRLVLLRFEREKRDGAFHVESQAAQDIPITPVKQIWSVEDAEPMFAAVKKRVAETTRDTVENKTPVYFFPRR